MAYQYDSLEDATMNYWFASQIRNHPLDYTDKGIELSLDVMADLIDNPSECISQRVRTLAMTDVPQANVAVVVPFKRKEG